MSPPDTLLHGFAYGEHVDAISQRSLGYRLLAPAEPQPWAAEVETLARQLQAAPYPEHWPPTDLFCSVLLSGGQRLVAVARYGLVDHTPSHRRGGLELIGTVGPAALGVKEAMAVYHWLRQRRAQADDLHALSGNVPLEEVLAKVEAAPLAVPSDPVPVLPVRLWQDGVLLFAATAPSDPDHRLSLLEQAAEPAWQWLPLAGADFPWQTFAQRGPVIAWTPHLAGVALKLDRRSIDEPARASSRRRFPVSVPLLIALASLLLLAANLWAMLRMQSRVAALGQSTPAIPSPTERPVSPDRPPTTPGSAAEDARDRFAEALYALLLEQGGRREWSQSEAALLARYEQAAQKHKELRLSDGNTKGKMAVGAASILSQRSADRVEELVRKALSEKGFHPKLVDAACEMVHQQMAGDASR